MTEDDDTMRPEYDFSRGVRGVTAKRYAEGANMLVMSGGADVPARLGVLGSTLAESRQPPPS